MTIGKRLRFEILKRDGFRCRYCGVTPLAGALRVDHVHPVAAGGSDDPVNLVTACFDCNAGKSDVGLDERRILPAEDPVARAIEHGDQIREYLRAQEIVEAERLRVSDWLADRWREAVGNDPPKVLYQRWRNLAQRHPLDHLCAAIDAVGNAGDRLGGDPVREAKYFHTCLRNLASGPGQT